MTGKVLVSQRLNTAATAYHWAAIGMRGKASQPVKLLVLSCIGVDTQMSVVGLSFFFFLLRPSLSLGSSFLLGCKTYRVQTKTVMVGWLLLPGQVPQRIMSQSSVQRVHVCWTRFDDDVGERPGLSSGRRMS
jgi:hypothetical protein